jgi:RNA polymerase sigma-70 factor, ECF subfamily
LSYTDAVSGLRDFTIEGSHEYLTHLNPPESQTPDDEASLLEAGFRFAMSLTHHREEAEDLIQEAWLNLCRRYGGVESRALLFTTLRNLFIDQCRRKKKVFFESIEEEGSPEPAEAPAVEPALAGDIAKLLECLRPAEREVIFLHYYLGHTADEIAELTARSRGTVLSLLHRTVAKLRQEVDGMPGAFRCNQWVLFFVAQAAAQRFLARQFHV